MFYAAHFASAPDLVQEDIKEEKAVTDLMCIRLKSLMLNVNVIITKRFVLFENLRRKECLN